jgi:hypothetical protein
MRRSVTAIPISGRRAIARRCGMPRISAIPQRSESLSIGEDEERLGDLDLVEGEVADDGRRHAPLAGEVGGDLGANGRLDHAREAEEDRVVGVEDGVARMVRDHAEELHHVPHQVPAAEPLRLPLEGPEVDQGSSLAHGVHHSVLAIR